MFGGFGSGGSRVNSVHAAQVNANGTVVWSTLKAAAHPSKTCPIERNSHSAVSNGTSLFVFGGQDDENNKLGDLWEFNLTTKQWAQIGKSLPDHARSGHTAVAFGNKMYVFGGILEVTKELNDLLVYDF